MDKKDKKDVIIFLIITFTLSWAIWLISGILFRQGDFVYDSKWLIAQAGVFAPSGTAAILMSIRHRERRSGGFILAFLFLLIFGAGFLVSKSGAKSAAEIGNEAAIPVMAIAILTLGLVLSKRYYFLIGDLVKSKKIIRGKWIVASLIMLPLLFLLSWLLVAGQEQGFRVEAFQGEFIKSIWILLLIFSMNLLLGGSVGEELGWRGYLLPLLLKKYTPAGASLILGLIWAAWHLPVDLTSDSGFGLVVSLFRILWTLPLTIIFTWFFIKTGGSLLIALLLHTSVNMVPDLGFNSYEPSLRFMTLLLIGAAFILGSRSLMRNKIAVDGYVGRCERHYQ